MAQESKPSQAGKPGKPNLPKNATRAEKATANLQYVVDRTANMIHDGSSSYAIRARRAAKAGVQKATVLKGFGAMEAALADCRAAIERAYAPEQKREAPKSRVALLG